MKSTIQYQAFFLAVLAIITLIMLPSCGTTPPGENVWSMLAKGDEKAKGFFIGEVDVHETDANGRTPLHYAAEHDNLPLATLFISMGADVDAIDNTGKTPLLVCAENGNAQAARAIVAAGADIHKAGEDGISPAGRALHDSVFLPALLTPQSLVSTDTNGKTILHLASEAGNAAAITTILASDESASEQLVTQDSKGQNPLDIALSRPDSQSHMEAAEQLILAGAVSSQPLYNYLAPAVISANYDLRRADGIAPLHFAAAEGHEGLIAFLIGKKANVNIKNTSGSTPLHEATRSGKIAAIRLIIQNGAEINAQDAQGNSVLHIAVPPRNHIEIIRLFMENGANPNLRDAHGDTPLHVLISLNRTPEVVQALLTNDIDISARNITGQTPLFLAIQENRVTLIPLLLSGGSDIFAADNAGITPFDLAMRIQGPVLDAVINPETVQHKDSTGNTMLHIAIRNKGNALTIAKILEQKANVNVRNREGDTPLHIAVRTNQKEAGEMLISNGANIFFANSKEESPLYTALTHSSGVLQWMFTPETAAAHDGLGNTMLHYVALWRMDRHIPFIIQKGVSTEAANATGETPLFWAVKYDGVSTVKTLLTAKANLHARDSLGNSVLHAAVRWNAKNAVVALLDTGIDANVHSLNMTTPLHDSVRLGITDIAVILINRGANIEVRDAGGNTPFMEAVRAGYTEAVDVLAKKGANAMTRNINGDTPLHIAVLKEDTAMTRYLLNMRVSIHARNTKNRTPFQIALGKSPETVALLLTQDRITSADDFGNSPLHIAVQEKAVTSTLRAIIAKKAPLDAVDSNGRIPLRLAVDLAEWDAVKTLSDAESNPFSVAVDNKTPSEIVISKGNDAIRAMFSGKAITAKDSSGNTALHYAARMGKPESISLLLELGASKNEKNISAESPADIAMRWNNRDNATLLN